MEDVNDQLVLVSGESGTGKSASLMNLRNQEKVMYLNCEAGKRLPFRNKFQTFKITDPYQVLEAFDHAKDNPEVDVIVLDTLTFLMDMFESQYVVGSANTMQAWGQYGQFFKTIMQDKVASSDKQVVILAHTRSDLDEKAMEMKTSVPIKGALKNNGIEAYFSTVVSTKKVTLKELKTYESDLLNITDQDEMLGFKHVFQTQLTKATVGERIRSPMGMFTQAQTYMDNDVQILLDHLHEYYN
jgi:KaiC/GvpD/RAD55 family RecA-like ATPase